MARSSRGRGQLGLLLRKMPGPFRVEMVAVLTKGGEALRAAIKARTPRKSGALQAGIDYKVWPKSLRLKVGLLGTKAGRSPLFYGRIQDRGRKAQTVRVRRARSQPYVMKVRGMTGKQFVTGRMTELRDTIRTNLNGIFARALARLSGGGGG